MDVWTEHGRRATAKLVKKYCGETGSGRADDTNRGRMFDIVAFLYNEAPGACWGSREKVQKWLDERRELPHSDLDTIDLDHDLGTRDLTDPFTGKVVV